MDRNQLCPIGKCSLHLDFMNHIRDSVHDIILGQYRSTKGHEIRDTPALTCTFHDLGGDESDSLRIVEFQPPRFSPFSKQRCRKVSNLSFSLGVSSMDAPFYVFHILGIAGVAPTPAALRFNLICVSPSRHSSADSPR